MARTRERSRIEPRESDIKLPRVLYGKLPPFSKMSMKGLEKSPMSVVLRRYKKGEVICRQGAPGWTAFYILTAEELREYRDVPRQQRELAAAEREKVEKEIAAIRNTSIDSDDIDAAKRAKDLKKLAELEEKRKGLAKALDAWEKYIPYIEEALPIDHTSSNDDRASGEVSPPATGAEGSGDSAGGVVIVRLAVPRPKEQGPSGLFGGLRRIIKGRRPGGMGLPPKSIPIDAPRSLDYETREDVLFEGELFGEMSCMYRSPRAAAVIAKRDCYVLEMLGNILDKMLEIEDFKAKTDRIYRERVLKLHLDALPILGKLDEEHREHVRRRAELVDFQAGDLIFDQHERPDGMYLIRSGVVKVIDGASALLDDEAIHSWSSLCEEVLSGAKAVEGPRSEVWKRLPAPLREKIAATPGATPAELKSELIDALNGLVMDPLLHESKGDFALARERRFTRSTWKHLADPGAASERDRVQCQRLLLESLYKTAMSKLKPGSANAEDGEASFLFRASDLDDWQPLAAALAAGANPARAAKDGPTPQDLARGKVWDLLPEHVRTLAREASQASTPKASPVVKKGLPPKPAPDEKKGDGLTPEQVRDLVAALNDVIEGIPLLLFEEFSGAILARNNEGMKLAERIREFLPNRRAWSQYDFKHHCRAFNRALLEATFPGGLRPRRPGAGPARILAYRSRGEFIGEMAPLDNSPRTATCVALSQALDDPKREVGPVQLVKIGTELFEELKRSDAFPEHVEAEAARRKLAVLSREQADRRAEARKPGDRVRREVAPLLRTPQGEELGLIQGRRLMVIDLDRCTRCDECVQACVATHNDGRSRLFLDGPRVGKYLVPATCRSCLDPVCMIGCPVGSIHRGDNGEILIRDWCIGCGMCSEQCPYAAIQMHDLGLIPEEAHDWQYRLADATAPVAPGDFEGGHDWRLGSTPVVNDREFRSLLGVNENTEGRAVLFRNEFHVGRSQLGPESRFSLDVASAVEEVAIWVNGRPAINGPTDRDLDGQGPVSKRERRGVGWELGTELESRRLRAGRNVVSVRVGVLPPDGSLLLKLRLGEVRQAEWLMGFVEDAAEKAIEQRAVVCDLCSSQLGQRPACVTACPHDAAIRIDARAMLEPG